MTAASRQPESARERASSASGARVADASVVVANPSALSWMPQMAAGLARASMLRLYCSTLSTTDDELNGFWRRVPERIRTPLGLRALPPDVESQANRRIATVSDILTVAALRARMPPVRRRVMAVKNRRFDSGVAAALRSDDSAVVTESGAAIHSIRRARELGVASILDYPITHHDFNMRMMREEARLVPDYAATIQGAEYEPKRLSQLDSEVRAADYIIGLSTVHANSFIEAGVDPGRMLMHPLGVDTSLFSPRPRPADGVFRVIFSGQITQRKGISYLVEGFKLAGIPNSELLMIGRPVGTSEPWIREPGVRHIGAVPRYQLPELYATGDVYVMPSLLEGCCLTPLEAMAMGIATIATPNTSDVITDGVDGLVVPIRDADAIAERLLMLHADPALAQRLGEAARLTAERHDWRRYGDEMAIAIAGAAEGRQRAPLA